MFKSVFAKYITAFSLIISVSFFILATIISSIIGSFSADYQNAELEHTADLAAELVNYGCKEEGVNDISAFVEQHSGGIRDIINYLADEKGGSSLLLVSLDWRVLVCSTDIADFVSEYEYIAQDIIDQVTASFAENEEYAYAKDLNGEFQGNMTVCARRILSENNEMLGYVFTCAPTKTAENLMNAASQAIVMSCIWVMLAALIAFYFLTDHMMEPIKRMSAAAHSYAKGKFDTRIEVTGQDEIAELSTAFNNMADSLDHLEKMRNSFLANVSHDLRTPMTTIAGFIDNINSGAIPPEKQPYYLNLIATEIHRLSRLVREILDISRLESGERKFTFVKCDLCETARLILISFEQRIDEKRLDVSFESTEDSMYVTADKDALHQVLYNLCENALKFSNEKGTLAIAIQDRAPDMTAISICNEGIGIPKEDLPFVFDRFYKGDKSRGLDKNGVGLGLYIVKTIVEAHGGTIGVESEEGKWCRFTVCLPKHKEK